MTRLVIETDDAWTKKKIERAIHTEIETLERLKKKLKSLEEITFEYR
ncbi:MAG: hypothetical protein K8F52_13275 [Candidatus Scalindua rubra]|uniref:Uncharacterized protein n=1 Tax=Candidatus Scalindua brodae TaxID=237368 RepID=A0A0B0EEA9_9BACT|nr:MAG: hypothetical protein SCABRO_03794 [Candidatus Scalindua brodae]MBZ0109631.1 hypothetical protein [Candidatus Scalindua rubra]TWU33114.1 hypothetical protein S225a_15640 [Candidatus Brocadiaceae bacterium S225]